MNSLRQRLLRDIIEIQTKPYPNIAVKVQDGDITSACLVLTVEGYGDMHLTVQFPDDYPLNPPKIQMNSAIKHPNIFGTYICSSILNTTEGYTSAYTLKGVAIQLLSFFSSDRVEQTGGEFSVDLDKYKTQQSYVRDSYACRKCRFGMPGFSTESFNQSGSVTSNGSILASVSPLQSLQDAALWLTPQESSPAASPSSSGTGSTPPGKGQILGRNARRRKAKQNAEARAATLPAISPPTHALTDSSSSSIVAMEVELTESAQPRNIVDMKLPNEVVLLICDQLDTEDLMVFAQAWARIPHVMSKFDVIRTRELQCFCLKNDYLTVKLGVGVHVSNRISF